MTVINALIIKDNKLLVVKEDDWFLLPGGRPEENESDHQTLVRELNEEVSINIISSEFYYSFSFNEGVTVSDTLELKVYFVTYEGVPTVTEDISEILWLDKESYAERDDFPRKWSDTVFKKLKDDNLIDLID